MKVAKNIIFKVFFCVAAVFAFWALGYDNLVIHPELSRAGIEIYGKNSDTKLTKEQANWIVEGSIAEDTDPRYLNHFYDPTTSKGLNDGIFSGKSAKEWAQKQDSLTGDYSESAILGNYKQGDYKRAYQGIGHILHLVQDMSVPAHTRNDSHADGDPYEKWAEQNGDVNPKNASFIKIDNLNQVFDELASYSHNNFFSKDTIQINNLGDYKIIEEINNGIKDQYFAKEISGIDYKLCLVLENSIKFTCKIDKDPSFYKVHLDYWNLLYPKAVGYSAGVINHFINQFKQIDQQKQEKEKFSLWGKTKSFFSELGSDAKYVMGDSIISARINIPIVWNDMKSTVVGMVDTVKTATQKTATTIKDVFSNKKVSPMAGVANIGQIASSATIGDQQLMAGDNRQPEIASPLVGLEARNDNNISPVIPVETGIQAQSIDSPLVAQNDAPAVIAIRPPTGGLAEKQSEIIHAPYQWAEVVHAPYGGELAVENKAEQSQSSSQNIQPINDGKPAFAGAGGSDVVVVENNPDADSSPTAQNDIPSVILADAGVHEDADSSPESQNDGEEIAQEDTEPESQPTDDIIAIETPPPPSPQINFYLTNYNVRSQNFTLNWEDENNAIQDWGLEYRVGPNFEWEILLRQLADQNDSDGDVQDDSDGNSYQFTARYDDITYYFRLRGQDASGNLTDWQTLQADISASPIAINEIAWMGTTIHHNNEWIELANKTDQEIDMTGWKIKSQEGSPVINITLTGKISPNGYYLLERTGDDSVPNIIADQIYTGTLNNDGQMLTLTDSNNNEIDKIFTDYAGDNNTKQTAERISIWSDGIGQTNWKTSQDILGTPKSENSQADLHFTMSTIGTYQTPQSVILLKNRGPYIASVAININPQSTLVIEPGTVLKFDYYGGLNVLGNLIANGTPQEKIIFTSFKDDEYGGDTNNDGNNTTPQKGDWMNVVFAENSSGAMENAIFRYGVNIWTKNGVNNWAKSMVYIGDKTDVDISNTAFEYSGGDALAFDDDYLNDNQPNIELSNNEFKNNTGRGVAIAYPNDVNISNNIFENNSDVGVWLGATAGGKTNFGNINISNNSFISNKAPIQIDKFADYNISGNTIANNTHNGVYVYSSAYITEAKDSVTLSSDIPFIFDGNGYVDAGKILNVSPGTIFKIGSMFQISGTLNAIGTAEKPVVFTALTDDQYGGDSNNDSDATAPTVGSWYWMQFAGGGENSVMDNTIVRYAGKLGYSMGGPPSGGSGVYIDSGVSNFTMRNSLVSDSVTGMTVLSEGAIIENSTFADNIPISDNSGLSYRGGVGLDIAANNATVSNVTFDNNQKAFQSNSTYIATIVLSNLIFNGNTYDYWPENLLLTE